ncbi:MAG: hypothetical protein RIE77_10535 [Phycisphaerales bacterium]|jgi:uncharacterized protein (TIGR03546 family)
MLTRKIGKLIRGKVTPVQVSMACVLGAMIGFVPSAKTSPALLLFLLALLLILNANLFVATVVAAGSKVLSLLIMPVQFGVGRAVLDGPLGGLMGSLINAPVLAWFGFEYYATSGGLVLGVVVGAIAATAMVLAIGRLRRTLAGLEEGSDRYKRTTSKKWVRGLVWVFFGKQKKTYAELAEKRVGLPVRPLGIVVSVLMVGLAWIATMFLAEPVVTYALKTGLERANGATVDVGSADIDLSDGQLIVTSLAVADPEDLTTDVFRAARLEGNFSNADLLRKRFAIDRLVASEASTGEQRATPGVLVRPRREPPEPEGEGKTLEDYLEQAEKWRDRLRQVREWLEKASDKKPGEEDAGPGAPPEEEQETFRDRLEREIAEKGYAFVAADHLVDDAPTFLVREIVVEGMTSADVPGEVFDARAENVSTQPWLVDGAPKVTVRSRSGSYEADVALGSAARGGGNSTLLLARRGIPADSVSAALRAGGDQPLLAGGTVDAVIEGAFRPDWISLPLNVLVRGSTITLPGAGSAQVDELRLPIGVTGPLDAPVLDIDTQAWSDALVQAGATQLANELRGEVQEEIDRAREKVEEKIGDEVRDRLGGLLPGRKKPEDGGG